MVPGNLPSRLEILSTGQTCLQKVTPTACALLEFIEAPLRILRVSGVVGTFFHFSRFGHSCFVLELVASSDLHSDSDVSAASQSAISFLTVVK